MSNKDLALNTVDLIALPAALLIPLAGAVIGMFYLFSNPQKGIAYIALSAFAYCGWSFILPFVFR